MIDWPENIESMSRNIPSRKRRPQASGTRASNARFTQKQVDDIRKSDSRTVDLAAGYGVDVRTIQRIRAGSTY